MLEKALIQFRIQALRYGYYMALVKHGWPPKLADWLSEHWPARWLPGYREFVMRGIDDE